jgi:hypothetical protein
MAENPPTLKEELKAQRTLAIGFSVHIRAATLRTYTTPAKEYGP